jgi:hypothetical protein
MPKAEWKMPEDFLLKISRLGDQTDVIIPRVLEAGGKVLLARVKGNLSAVIGRGIKSKSRSTGELARSLGLSRALPKRDGSGWDVKVGFREPRRGKGASNARIAAVLEYGKHGQPAKPFMNPARPLAKNPAIEAMKDKLAQEVEGI